MARSTTWRSWEPDGEHAEQLAAIHDLQVRLGDIVMTASWVESVMRDAYSSTVGGDHAYLLAAGMNMGPMTKTILKVTASPEAARKYDPDKLRVFVDAVKALSENSTLWQDRNAAVHGHLVAIAPLAFNHIATQRSRAWTVDPAPKHWTREQMTQVAVDLTEAGLDLQEAWIALFDIPQFLSEGPVVT